MFFHITLADILVTLFPITGLLISDHGMNGAQSSLEDVFLFLRPDDLGDNGLLGGRLGALQALQVPPDLLHHLF